ncbi:MAG TPA: hypothetical protein VGU44_04345 [Gammaproteobacteria bacterium]|nr:hypothetical protein [Gammaproteobacteria bacterium]HEV2613075.1 hypothetical protein [Gammaproteobacteria bacterium]
MKANEKEIEMQEMGPNKKAPVEASPIKPLPIKASSIETVVRQISDTGLFRAIEKSPLTSALPVALVYVPESVSDKPTLKGILLGKLNKQYFFKAFGENFIDGIGVECRTVTTKETGVDIWYRNGERSYLPPPPHTIEKKILFHKADFVLLFAEDLDEAGLTSNLKLAMENLPNSELYGISYEEKRVTFTPIKRENAAETLNAHVAHIHKKPVVIDPAMHCAFARALLTQSAQLVSKPVAEEKNSSKEKSFFKKIFERK